MHLCVLTRFPKARENAAERQRSRSEADTGRRTGPCFWACCSSGGKTVTGFPAVPGRVWGLAGAVNWAVLVIVLWSLLWVESEYLSLHVNGRPAALGCGPKYSAFAPSSFSAGCGRKRTRQIGDELGGAFAVRRTAGLARWAFGPPGERAARNQQNGVNYWPGFGLNRWSCSCDLLGSRSPPPPHAADCCRLRANSAICRIAGLLLG